MDARTSSDRFTGRAEVYDRYRPGYPRDMLQPLRVNHGLGPSHVIADVGSGTGKLSEVFLANGNTVFAVEPNADMRRRAESLLERRAGFRSVDGSAEDTGLGDRSVDIVAAGQAFHWFDPGRCRGEFRRILRPGGVVVLAWNVRDREGSPFLRGYDDFLREFSVDYESVSHRGLVAEGGVRTFFTDGFAQESFPNPRALDFESVWGGYLSASYSLPDDDNRFPEARSRLRALFDAHQVNGTVGMPLRTDVYYGRI